MNQSCEFYAELFSSNSETTDIIENFFIIHSDDESDEGINANSL